MICKCGGETTFTLVMDEYTKLYILECQCPICGKMSHGVGHSIDEALHEVKKDWIRRRRKKKCV